MTSKNRVASIRLTRVAAPSGISADAIGACAAFGIAPRRAASHPPRRTEARKAMLDCVRPGEIMLLIGRSGAGKSSLLRGMAAGLGGRGRRIIHVPDRLTGARSSRAVFDLLAGPAHERAAALALAGLAEPRLWALPASCVSVGERARLRLAMAMSAARAGDVVIADELASTIDRATAYALCATLRRWVRRSGVALIAASAHEDLGPMLAPDTLIDAARQSPLAPGAKSEQPVTIGPGTIEDYRALAHLHYRAGEPAAVVRVLRAVRDVPAPIDPSGKLLAGVLLVSMPTLNASWRDRAWPGFFHTGDKSLNAQRLNARLRTISRVIVEARSRGLGVATALVRAYLRDPLTPGTEALASMGAVCPFFERAGMTGYDLAPTIADTRLLDALAHLRLAPARLMDHRVGPGTLLERELTTWGKARKLLPRGTPTTDHIARLTPIAACRLCSRPRAYAFVKGEDWHEREHAGGAARGGS